MKRILIVFLCFLSIGCSNEKEDLYRIMEENDYIIIDVRTKEEYQEHRIKDSINIPYDEIDENIDLDKNKINLFIVRVVVVV